MQPPALHNIHAADGKRHIILCMKLSVAHHHLTLQPDVGYNTPTAFRCNACKLLSAYLNILYAACFRACSGQAIKQRPALLAQNLQRLLGFLLEGNFAPCTCTGLEAPEQLLRGTYCRMLASHWPTFVGSSDISKAGGGLIAFF